MLCFTVRKYSTEQITWHTLRCWISTFTLWTISCPVASLSWVSCDTTNPRFGHNSYFMLHFFVSFVFLPSPSISVSDGLCYDFRRWVRPCFRRFVRVVSYKPVDEIRQTLVNDVAEATDELSGFWRSRGQGQGDSKVIYLSDLLRRAETSTSTLGRWSVI